MVQTTHLSLTDAADGTSGILFEPATDPDDPTTTGGWAGRSRTAGRVLLAVLLAAAGGVVAFRRLGASNS